MRHWRRFILLLVGLLAMAGVARAAEIYQQVECVIGPNETIEGNVYVICRDLLLQGRVNGHVIGMAFNAEISGEVSESVYLIGGNVDISGLVSGDIHFVGAALDILPESQLPTADLLSIALSSRVHVGTNLDGVVATGYQAVVDGDVRKDIDFWGAALVVGGSVGRNIGATVGNGESGGTAAQLETLLIPFSFEVELVEPGLVLRDGSQIEGNLIYRGAAERPPVGEVLGEETFIRLDTVPTLTDLASEEDRVDVLAAYLNQIIREFTTLALIGAIGLLIVPQAVQQPTRTLHRNPLTSLGSGLLTFVLSFPVVFVVIFLSLLLIILLGLLRLDGVVVASGVILGIVNIGGTSLFYFIAIYVARTIFCIAVGRLIVTRILDPQTLRSWYASLILGVLLLALFASLPVIGTLINALALFFGLGSILIVVQGQLRSLREQGPVPVPVYYRAEDTITLGPRVPPPVLDEQPRPLGMDDLPDGFDWWGDDETK